MKEFFYASDPTGHYEAKTSSDLLWEEIGPAGMVVTIDTQKKFFPQDWTYKQIRKWLKGNGINQHLAIERNSSAVALICPSGLIMQVRVNTVGGKFELGFFGGENDHDGDPRKCAVREVREETELGLSADDLIFTGVRTHRYTYSNGDVVVHHEFDYICFLDEDPELTLDYESNGYRILGDNNAENLAQFVGEHHQEFLKLALAQIVAA